MTHDEARALIADVLHELDRGRTERLLWTDGADAPDTAVYVSECEEDTGRTVWLRQGADIIGVPLDEWGHFIDACERWNTHGGQPAHLRDIAAAAREWDLRTEREECEQ